MKFWKSLMILLFWKAMIADNEEQGKYDADVPAWYKSEGKGYQTKNNKVLRDVMMQSM